MKKYFIFPLLLLVSACVTSTFLYTDEKGNPVYQVKCGGAMRTYGDCFAEMGKRCPAGFNILMSQEQQVGNTTDQNISGGYSGTSNTAVNMFGSGATGYGQSSGNIGLYNNAMTMGIFSRYVIYSCKI